MELPEEENTPEKRVDRIFAMMDKVSILLFCYCDDESKVNALVAAFDVTSCSLTSM